ncbi:hypothetical protein D8674_009327 [Pyrus ussuriensis x Pyrus communis]|uniref:Uncharacterized protein n=1 Tax=Pyrus ussuriensis x Pyrus communis TaxID=2448454 RepID=A0A5N5F7M5_9ROSA|nr:hypothetical protein D8674_009327 [Pyrus ussuriensis x Pyrus communis]
MSPTSIGRSSSSTPPQRRSLLTSTITVIDLDPTASFLSLSFHPSLVYLNSDSILASRTCPDLPNCTAYRRLIFVFLQIKRAQIAQTEKMRKKNAVRQVKEIKEQPIKYGIVTALAPSESKEMKIKKKEDGQRKLG